MTNEDKNGRYIKHKTEFIEIKNMISLNYKHVRIIETIEIKKKENIETNTENKQLQTVKQYYSV